MNIKELMKVLEGLNPEMPVYNLKGHGLNFAQKVLEVSLNGMPTEYLELDFFFSDDERLPAFRFSEVMKDDMGTYDVRKVLDDAKQSD